MQKSALCSVAGMLAMTLELGAAQANGLPGMRGHDHTGITVPDMNEALTFFVDVLGCKKAMSFGPIADPEPNRTFMNDALGVDPKTVIKQITLVRCGMGSRSSSVINRRIRRWCSPRIATSAALTSRFRWTTSRRRRTISTPRASRRRWGPIPITEGPAAGQAIVYFNAPWGLQLEAISYPKGMAYEKDASTILWTPKDPAK
jgi:catechol 2,3-dioxygenase-like lactoylglutathione lyase family enzyme